MPDLKVIDRLRFLEAQECEMAFAERDQVLRNLHFQKAALHASRMTLLKRKE